MNKKMRHIDFSFGASLRNAREKRNYRREQIAERAEISPRFLAAIESGRRKPSLDVLIRRLVPQCSQRDQELLLALIDKMLDTKEKKDNK